MDTSTLHLKSTEVNVIKSLEVRVVQTWPGHQIETFFQ